MQKQNHVCELGKDFCSTLTWRWTVHGKLWCSPKPAHFLWHRHGLNTAGDSPFCGGHTTFAWVSHCKSKMRKTSSVLFENSAKPERPQYGGRVSHKSFHMAVKLKRHKTAGLVFDCFVGYKFEQCWTSFLKKTKQKTVLQFSKLCLKIKTRSFLKLVSFQVFVPSAGFSSEH